MSLDFSANQAIVPNPRTPKLLGTLSIVFASILLVCDVFGALIVAFGPTMSKAMESSVKVQQEAFNAQMKAEKDALDAREKVAKTDIEKAQIENERAALRSRPNPMVTMNTAGLDQFRDPKIMATSYFQLVTGVTLNVLMLASGVGLIGLKGWGRKLAVWVAGLKIVRLAVLLVLSVVVVLPGSLAIQKKQFEQMEAQMKANGGGGMPPGFSISDMTKMVIATTYAFVAVYYLLAPIFPIIVVSALNRPRIKAAFATKTGSGPGWEELQ